MDGYEVAARLRREECCKDAVIIAVSGYGQEEDRRRSKEAGFDHHLVKPVDHDALHLAPLRGGERPTVKVRAPFPARDLPHPSRVRSSPVFLPEIDSPSITEFAQGIQIMKRVVSEVPRATPRLRRAVAALRIQPIGRNRGQASAYGDSIEGRPLGEGPAARKSRHSAVAGQARVTPATPDRAPWRSIPGVQDERPGSRDGESPVTLRMGGLGDGDSSSRSLPALKAQDVSMPARSGVGSRSTPPLRWTGAAGKVSTMTIRPSRRRGRRGPRAVLRRPLSARGPARPRRVA